MKLDEFLESSKRTLADGPLKINTQIEINLLHSAIGVATEVGEIISCMEASNDNPKKIDVVNLAEECADVMWYLAIPIRDFSLNISIFEESRIGNFDLKKLVIDSADYLDMLKKVVFYGKPIDATMVDYYVCKIYKHINAMSYAFCFDLELAMQNNQDKLRARFPDKYDNEKALNRNLIVERAELEKGV